MIILNDKKGQKAWKRPGNFGILTYNPNLSKIWLIKMKLSKSIFIEHAGVRGWDKDPKYLWYIHFTIELAPLSLNFAETKNVPLKIGQICKNSKKDK